MNRLKREYQAPKLVLENFALAERVCGCSYQYVDAPSDVKTGLEAVYLFTPGEGSCLFMPSEGGIDYNGDGEFDVCYHTVADAVGGVIIDSKF